MAAFTVSLGIAASRRPQLFFSLSLSVPMWWPHVLFGPPEPAVPAGSPKHCRTAATRTRGSRRPDVPNRMPLRCAWWCRGCVGELNVPRGDGEKNAPAGKRCMSQIWGWPMLEGPQSCGGRSQVGREMSRHPSPSPSCRLPCRMPLITPETRSVCNELSLIRIFSA